MAKSDDCILPISEVNKMTDELRDLRALALAVIQSARFAGTPLADVTAHPEDCSENSICAVNLRAMIKLRDAIG